MLKTIFSSSARAASRDCGGSDFSGLAMDDRLCGRIRKSSAVKGLRSTRNPSPAAESQEIHGHPKNRADRIRIKAGGCRLPREFTMRDNQSPAVQSKLMSSSGEQ